LQTAPLLSVIIPVYNGGAALGQCLDALLASPLRAYEIIVVDDDSTDSSGDLARRYGIEVLRLDTKLGPAAARNRGVIRARADLLLFIDADVVVRRDTLAGVVAFFRDRPDCAAVFGSYDDAPAERNFVSQYKNLLHHFVHQQSSTEAGTFWAGCGAIRRQAFEAVGGFDELKYQRPSIEDIELGYRLRRSGFRIILDKELQVKHLKRWNLLSLLRTDILNRALPWSKLVLEEDGMINDLNLRVADRISAALAWLAIACLLLSYFFVAFSIAIVPALIAIFLINLPCYRFLKARRGRWFALRAFGMLALHYFYSANVFAFCYCVYTVGKVSGYTPLLRSPRKARQVNDA
jgi:glycosyltransferase involved in cell wall biosynthesis